MDAVGDQIVPSSNFYVMQVRKLILDKFCDEKNEIKNFIKKFSDANFF